MRSSSSYVSLNFVRARLMALLTSGVRYPKLIRAEAASSCRKFLGSVGEVEGC